MTEKEYQRRQPETIVTEQGETGYDAIAKLILKYWMESDFFDTVIVNVGTSYDGEDWTFTNEVAFPNEHTGICFLEDWWEGEKFVKLFGIKFLKDIKI